MEYLSSNTRPRWSEHSPTPYRLHRRVLTMCHLGVLLVALNHQYALAITVCALTSMYIYAGHFSRELPSLRNYNLRLISTLTPFFIHFENDSCLTLYGYFAIILFINFI